LIASLHSFEKFVNHRQILADLSSLMALSAFCAITLSFDIEKP